MTFDQLVAEVMDRMNLTSTQAQARIGRTINEKYRELASSCGFNTIRRGVATATTTIGNQYLQFGPTPNPVMKVMSVFNTAFNPYFVLTLKSFDEIRNQVPGTDPAQEYAIALMGADNVTVFLNSIPGSAYVLSADVLMNVLMLSGTDSPAFAESFHNCLIYSAQAVEANKMEKPSLAEEYDAKSEKIISELRYFIAKNAYQDIVQNKASVDWANGSIPLVT